MMENGALLLGRYQVLEPLGEGGSSKVVKAQDTKMDRVVAVKTIPAGRKAAVRALREAKTVALLNHPNIVTLFEFEQSDNSYHLIMEFVDGQSLAAVLDRFKRLPVELALAIAIQVCDALDFAHQNDVIHRDIKPGNLRILLDGRIKVMDFGIARLLSAAKTGSVTAENEVVGTFAYMSPEQSSGEMVDERSDLFSLGVLLYQMVTGRLPFLADTPAGTIFKIINEEPPAPCDLEASVSPALSQTIAKAIAKSPDDRFATTEELKLKLERFRQSAETPTVVVKEMMVDLREPQGEAAPGSIGQARRELAVWLKQHNDTLTTTGFATGTALGAAWADSYLPFFPTQLKLFFPVSIFFLALFLPPAGLAALLALVAAGLWQISPYLGVAAAALFVVYWLTLGRGFPQIAILPLLAPLLAWLKVPFLFPLAAGLVFSPLLAAFLAGAAALAVAVAEVIGQLNYSWSIGLRPDLVDSLKFSSQFTDLKGLFDYFKAQPWILGQMGIWAAIGLIMGAIKEMMAKNGHWPALIAGAVGLTAGYRVVPTYLAVKYDFSRFFLQPLAISLIILVALIFIVLDPSRRPSE